MASRDAPVPSFLSGGGELGTLIAQYGWAATSLGGLESWPQSLVTAVSILVHSTVPMVMLWGEDGVMIYNDAYSIFAPDGDSATVLTPWRRDGEVLSLGGPRRLSDYGSYADRLHRGTAVVVEDARRDAVTVERIEVFSGAGIAAFVNLPLLEAGSLVGMILVTDDRDRRWPEEDLAFLRSVADRTWAALETAAAEAELLAFNLDLERQVEERTAERDRVWKNSRDLLVTLGTDGIFRAVSPAWTVTLGHPPSEVVGRSFLDFIHPRMPSSRRAPSRPPRGATSPASRTATCIVTALRAGSPGTPRSTVTWCTPMAATSRRRRSRPKPCNTPRIGCGRARRWRPSVNSPAASPMISTTGSPGSPVAWN